MPSCHSSRNFDQDLKFGLKYKECFTISKKRNFSQTLSFRPSSDLVERERKRFIL